MGSEGDRKLIYVGKFNNSDDKTSWLVIDPPNGDKGFSVTGSSLKLQRPPEGLKKLVFTSATVWGSTIYFIGGGEADKDYSLEEMEDPSWSPLEIYSKQVFSFDTKSDTWEKANRLAPMKSPRLAYAVVAAAGKIFVFGFFDNNINYTNREDWAECYDIVNNEWSSIKAPPEGLPCGRGITSVAVYEELILLWVTGFGVCSLDTNTKLWNLNPYPELSKGPESHCIALYNLKERLNLDWKTVFGDCYEVDTHLVHVGDDRLCLVWGDR